MSTTAPQDNPWTPLLIGGVSFLLGISLAYVVTTPKTIEQRAHEMLHESMVREHAKKLHKKARLRRA